MSELNLPHPFAFVGVITSNPDSVRDYFGFGAELVEEGRDFGDRVALVISIPRENADWLAQRLGSGLHGARVLQHVGDWKREIGWKTPYDEHDARAYGEYAERLGFREREVTRDQVKEYLKPKGWTFLIKVQDFGGWLPVDKKKLDRVLDDWPASAKGVVEIDARNKTVYFSNKRKAD